MKPYIYIFSLTILSYNLSISQNQQNNRQFVKYDAPIQIIPSMDYGIKIFDSTNISTESFTKIKNARTLLKSDKSLEALSIINTISETDLEKNELLFLKGTLELKADEFINASNSFSKYLSLVSNDSIKSSIYFMLGILDIKKEYFLSAFSNLKKSYDLDNNNLFSAIALATLSQNKNDLKNAEFYYHKAVEINPNLNNVWNQLASIYQQTDNHSEAEKIFSKIIKDEPNAPLPYNNRGYSNLKLGHTKQALKDVNKSIQLLPTNSYAFRNRALIYIELKEKEQACRDIETAMKLGYAEKYGSDLSAVKTQNCGT